MGGRNLKIAPDFFVSDWKALTFASEEDWEKAVAIFTSRIEGRFLSVLDEVAKIQNGGFILLAMDCALVETLQQFRLGETRDKPPSKKQFVAALRAHPFSKYFADDKAAERFYKHFRCGLLHRAQTGPKTRLSQEGQPVYEDGNELVVNRDAFHQLVRTAFSEYVALLKDPANKSLRDNFRIKMDHVANSREALHVS